jgi:hypothetical protein
VRYTHQAGGAVARCRGAPQWCVEAPARCPACQPGAGESASGRRRASGFARGLALWQPDMHRAPAARRAVAPACSIASAVAPARARARAQGAGTHLTRTCCARPSLVRARFRSLPRVAYGPLASEQPRRAPPDKNAVGGWLPCASPLRVERSLLARGSAARSAPRLRTADTARVAGQRRGNPWSAHSAWVALKTSLASRHSVRVVRTAFFS